jgi:hypothetical protein
VAIKASEAPGKFPRWAALCGALLVTAGMALRLAQYLSNRSLFIDEAALALNIRDRTSFDLLSGHLDGAQTGAPLFILLLRALLVLLGDCELVLRLPSVVGGLLSVHLFHKLADRLVPHPWHLFATFLFAFSFPLTYYAADLKPYALDVLASSLIILAVLTVRSRGLSHDRSVYLAATGSLMALLSQPAVFVLASALLALASFFFVARDWTSMRRLSLVAVVWALASGVTLWYSRRTLGEAGLAYMERFWSDAFLPFPPTRAEHWWTYFLSVLGFGVSPIGSVIPGVLVLALIGVIALVAEDRWALALLAGPIAMVVLASAAQLYPFRSTNIGEWPDGRVVLFLAPAVIIMMGRGMALLWRSTFKLQRGIVLAASACAVAGNLFLFRNYPVEREELRPILTEVAADFRPTDFLYVYYGAQYAYRYYAPHIEIPSQRVFFGRCARGATEIYFEELRTLPEAARVWVVASHPYQDEVNHLSRVLDVSGAGLRVIEGVGAWAGLYDLQALRQGLGLYRTRPGEAEMNEACSGIHRYQLIGFANTGRDTDQ